MKRNFAVKNLLTLFLAFSFIFPSLAAAQTATRAKSPARKAAEAITAKQMSDYLYFIASDEMEGRDTPSRGLDTTAKFIGMNLARWGFKPAGDDGTFYQKIALNIRRTDTEKTRLKIGENDLPYGRDFFSNAATANVAASPLVFAGSGWFIKQKNIDEYKDLDVKGKTVVIYADEKYPAGVTEEDLYGGKYGRVFMDWSEPINNARQKGAAGLIIIASPKTERNWLIEKQTRERGVASVEKFSQLTISRSRNIPLMTISPQAAENLFQNEGVSFADVQGMAKTGAALPKFTFKKTADYTVADRIEKASTQNVVAVWEGSDANLKQEMVAVGAHYDHVGMDLNSPRSDKIWNGADDDGSGTTAILSIAEALSKSAKRPKRSILFVWHCGEEKGLWGSQYFTNFPTVDLKNVVAQLNIDMIGRTKKADDVNPKNKDLSGASEVYVIGSEMMSSKLGAEVKSVNDSYLKLNYNFRYDDTKDPNRFFFRSDHFNYAVKGIPISFWFDGVHEDYHQPGDEPQKIDYNKMQMVARTIFLTMWEIADLKERPKVDRQLPPELMTR